MNFDEFVAQEDNFLKRINNIYISQKQIDILEKYGIYLDNYKTLNELIYHIEEYLNNSEPFEDLEWVSESLSEYNYYTNINK